MNPIVLHIPAWAVPGLVLLTSMLSLLTVIANVTSHLSDDRIAEVRALSPRLAALLVLSRHWGIIVRGPAWAAAWTVLRGAVKIVPAVMAMLFMITLTSCGAAQRSWSDNAHIGVNLSTHGLRDADDAITTLYAAEARRAHTVEALNAVDARYQPALESEQVALASLRAAEHAIDTALLTGASDDKCRVYTLLLRAHTHTADAIRIARLLGVTIDDATVSSVNAIESALTSLAPSCGSSSSPSVSSGGSL